MAIAPKTPGARKRAPAKPAPPSIFPPTEVPSRSQRVVLGEVRVGDTWRFEANGRWTDWFVPCGPDGYKNFLWDVLAIRPRAPDLPWFCLTGCVEGSEELFAIGHGCEHTFNSSGTLVAFANDQLSRYGDNEGAVTVRGARLEMPLKPEDPMTTKGRFSGLVGAWRAVQDVMEKSRTVGVVTALVLLVCYAIAGMEQGRDLIQSIAEDAVRDAKDKPDVVTIIWRQSIFCISLLLLSIQAWIWPRMIIDTNCGRCRETWGPGRCVLEWMPRLLGGAPLLAVAYALVANEDPNGLLVGILVLLTAAFFAFVIYRKDFTARIRIRLAALAQRRNTVSRAMTDAGLGKVWVLGSVAAGFAFMVTFTFWPVGPAVFLGAPTVVFLGVGLMIPWVTIAVQQGRIFHIPVVGLALLVAALFSLSASLDNHAVGRRALGDNTPLPVAQRLDLNQAYAAWKARQPGDGPKLMVLVASEGGASRAGFWTGEVLSELHAQTDGRLANALFAISSVSGGSVGAVGYDVVLQGDSGIGPAAVRGELERLTGADALSPVVGGLLFPDLLYRFAPLGLLPDRAEALERAWEQAWGFRKPGERRPSVVLTDPFLSLRPQVAGPWRPILIVNGASEESGHPVLTSTITLPRGVDGYDFHELTGRDVSISTAIHNGARFPWISPAGTLTGHGRPQGHVIDGGYFDAVGVEAIRELARAIRNGPGRHDDIEFVFVVVAYGGPKASGPVTASTSPEEPIIARRLDTAPPRPTVQARPQAIETKWGLNEILAPMRGFFSSRDGHGAHMAEELIYAASPDHVDQAPGVYSSILLCEPGKFRNPMDWALSRRAQNHMRDASRADKDGRMLCPRAATEIKRLAALINTRPVAPPPPPSPPSPD